MKSVLIVGLGRFGRHIAKEFYERDVDCFGIDSKEDLVDLAMPYLTNAQIGDATDEQFMSSVGVDNFDCCIVTTGDNFQSSLVITNLLKELGASNVISKAGNDVHAKFLLKNGADEVIFTEKETAERLATRLSYDNIFDCIELTDKYSIFEIAVPKSWAGKSIIELDVRSKYNVNILATLNEGILSPMPSPSHIFTPYERLMVLGEIKDIKKVTKL